MKYAGSGIAVALGRVFATDTLRLPKRPGLQARAWGKPSENLHPEHTPRPVICLLEGTSNFLYFEDFQLVAFLDVVEILQ